MAGINTIRCTNVFCERRVALSTVQQESAMKRAGKLELYLLEEELRRLRGEYAHDWFVCAVARFDHAILRLVHRLML